MGRCEVNADSPGKAFSTEPGADEEMLAIQILHLDNLAI